MERKLILMGIGVLVIIMMAWYCMQPSTSAKSNLTVGNERNGRANIPGTLGDLTRLSKYKKPILGSVDSFLSIDECKKIIDIGKMIVEPSMVGFGTATKVDPSRSSQHGWLKSSATTGLTRLTQYISSILKVPPNHFEPYQIVNYGPSQFYKYHLDSCNPAADDYTECIKNLKQFGGRKYTVLIYLNKDYIGGETHFKEIDTLVKGDPGSMVFFNNMKPGSQESDPLSLHAGTPVISGEKWLLNVWIRDRPYTVDYTETAYPSDTIMKEIKARRTAIAAQEEPPEKHPTNMNDLPSKEPPKETSDGQEDPKKSS